MASFRDDLRLNQAVPLGAVSLTALLAATPTDALFFFRELVMWPAIAAASCVLLLGLVGLTFRSLRHLQQVLKTSAAANRAKARFVRGLSEELRMPMTDLVGMADLLSSSRLGADEAKTAALIQESAHALLEKLTNLLEYAQLDDGSLQTQRTDFDLHGLMEDTACRFARAAQAKGLRLSCCISPKVPHLVRGDPVLLDRLLSVLLGNAIRATRRGEVALTVRISADDDRSLSLTFEVMDTGPGIPLERQTQMLRQDWATRQGGATGTELGLAIAQLIAARFHGTLDLHSEEGKGSVFWALLQLERASIQVPMVHTAKLPPGLMVCVVSPSASVRKMTTWKMAVLGVRCHSLETAEFLPEKTAIVFVDGKPLVSVPPGTLQVALVGCETEAPPDAPFLTLPLRLSAVLFLLRQLSDVSGSQQLATLAEQVKAEEPRVERRKSTRSSQ